MDKQLHPLTLLSISILFILAIFLKIALMKLLILYIMILPYIQPSSDAVYSYFRKLLIIFFAVCSLVGLKLLYANENSTLIFLLKFLIGSLIKHSTLINHTYT
jgi:hypothetical protein